MLDSIAQLLNGPEGAGLLAGLKAAFLALLGLAAFTLIASPSGRRGATSYTLLRILFASALAAVLCYQVRWQLFGFTSPEFARFVRRYNRRPNAAAVQIMRGPILDRRGMVLAAPVPGDVWGRRYPLGEAAVHPLGYYSANWGLTEVERIEDAALSGCEGEEAPIFGKDGIAIPKRAKEGREVALTLDARLQLCAYEKLERRKGAVVALDPRTGEILALVSSPGFDPLAPETALADSESSPAFNRAVQGLYPPGSTFKILVAATALDAGRACALTCPGEGYIVGPHTPAIRDSEYYSALRNGAVWGGWGVMSLHEALVHSSNVYFAQLGVRLGTDNFNMMARRAHLGEAICWCRGSGGELKTAKGSAPAIEKPRLLAQPCIGQGALLVTPLHVACWTAAVAADGMLHPPHLMKDGAESAPAERLFSRSSARAVRSAMRDAVIRGTGKRANAAGLGICGKTGTAQTGSGEDHAWFTCFAPERSPRIVVTVLVERGGFGAKAALPVAVAVMEEADRIGYIRAGEAGR